MHCRTLQTETFHQKQRLSKGSYIFKTPVKNTFPALLPTIVAVSPIRSIADFFIILQNKVDLYN